MRLTPAQRHLQRKAAAAAAAAAPQGGATEGSAYELMQAQLYEHRRTLKAIQSVERKIEAKRQFLPLYQAWVDGVLQAGQGGQDLVLTTVFVWCIDVGEYERALVIGDYILQHGLSLPDQYARDPATTLIDEMADGYLRGRMPADQASELLTMVAKLTDGRDVPDQARAKLHKAIGYALIGKSGAGDIDVNVLPEEVASCALPHLRRAMELFQGVGVKKDIERLERRLRPAQA